MAIIEQNLFSWQAVEASSEISRFHHILEAIDDEALMRRLEAKRKGRRDDNPVRAMWNSLLAGIVFGHESIESLRRELMRNGELRQVCGFEVIPIERVRNGQLTRREPTPSKDAYHRFVISLCRHEDMLGAIFDSLTARLGELLPDFGQRLAVDGKAIPAARKDDRDAAMGYKKETNPDGDPTAPVTRSWLGYKLHMLCDAVYELPVAYRLTPASEHESPHLIGLLEDLDATNPSVLERAETLAGDKGYDDGADKKALHETFGVAPLIPARDLKDGRMEPLDPSSHDTIYVSPSGEVSCRIAPFRKEREKQFAAMAFMGFEKDRDTLKFRCPAAAYGLDCHNRAACQCSHPVKTGSYGRVVRVSLDKDRRLFGPVYQHSRRFEDLYKQRTSVERLFARLDHMYGFEHHNTVGLKRMRVRLGLALIAMQATAVGWIQASQPERMRSLRPPA